MMTVVPAPVVAAWGAGVNSTAMIIELVRRGEAPDAVLLAGMPEQPHTRRLIPIFRAWMGDHGVPNEIVEYRPTHFKHWPPYTDLLEASLTNGTLPSIAFGLHSCSARHKISPQDKWVKVWAPARRVWAEGRKVVRLIGYDCSERDNQRYAHRDGHVLRSLRLSLSAAGVGMDARGLRALHRAGRTAPFR